MLRVLIPIITGAISLTAGVAITWMVKPSAVELTFPGGVQMKMDGSQPIAHNELLDKIYSKKFSRDGLMGWLAEKKIYSFDDERLVTALENSLCSVPFPKKPIKQKADAEEECATKDVAARLRQLAEQKEVPFHYVGGLVTVGVPRRKDQPRLGTAHVCEEGEFRYKKIQLTNPENSQGITIQTYGKYPCTGYTGAPDIQLNFEDAQKIFPGPLDRHQTAVAVILN